MKVAIIGSRNLRVDNMEIYLPKEIKEIVSGGAKGIDECAREFAEKKGIPLKEFLPEYSKYGKGAPLKRNLQIIQYSDMVVALWDGKSKGTKYVIDNCLKMGKEIMVYTVDEDSGDTVLGIGNKY